MAISNWRFWGLCVGACLLSILTGCASVVHGTNQAVTIETLTADGKLIEGAECSVANDPAGHRSGDPCINGGMVGNVVLGGLVGAAMDAVRVGTTALAAAPAVVSPDASAVTPLAANTPCAALNGGAAGRWAHRPAISIGGTFLTFA